MSSEPVIHARDLGKLYPIYAQPQDRLKQALFRGRRRFFTPFWALRNVSFEVGDLDAALESVAAAGYGLVAGVGSYEDSVRMAYVRGPEGIVVSLFELTATGR